MLVINARPSVYMASLHTCDGWLDVMIAWTAWSPSEAVMTALMFLLLPTTGMELVSMSPFDIFMAGSVLGYVSHLIPPLLSKGFIVRRFENSIAFSILFSFLSTPDVDIDFLLSSPSVALLHTSRHHAHRITDV